MAGNIRALTKADILAADDLPRELVSVPEWDNGHVHVRVLTSGERDRWVQQHMDLESGKARRNVANITASLVALVTVDEKGARLFGDADVEALAAKNAAAVGRLFDIATKLNGLSQTDIEELAKN